MVGKQNIYKIVKNKDIDSRDLDQVRCIKNEEGNVLVTNEDTNNIWENQNIGRERKDL